MILSHSTKKMSGHSSCHKQSHVDEKMKSCNNIRSREVKGDGTLENNCTYGFLNAPNSIKSREIHPYSVHYNSSSGKFVATISICLRPDLQGRSTRCGESRRSYISYSFEKKQHAQSFCKSFSPPVMNSIINQTQCSICSGNLITRRSFRADNCANCGVVVCKMCSKTWSPFMMPKTYLGSLTSTKVTVCKNCDWLSHGFCMSLVKGRLDEAKSFVETGNINVRSNFADIDGEAM